MLTDATRRQVESSAGTVRIWTTALGLMINVRSPFTIGREGRFGNRCLHVRKAPKAQFTITLAVVANPEGGRRERRAVGRRGNRRVRADRRGG
jgi:hypothetical protein